MITLKYFNHWDCLISDPMAEVTSTWKKSNLGLMLEFGGILVLFGGYELVKCICGIFDSWH